MNTPNPIVKVETNWPVMLPVLRAAVALLAKPKGWRDSEYACTKAEATMSLQAIERAVAGVEGVIFQDVAVELTYFKWALLYGEMARLWKKHERRDPARAATVVKAYADLQQAVRTAPQTAEVVRDLEILWELYRKRERAETRATKLGKKIRDRLYRQQQVLQQQQASLFQAVNPSIISTKAKELHG